MKNLVLLALLLVAVCATAEAQDCSGATALQKHIYKPDRLVAQKGCITVTGIIRKKLKEGNGDFPVRLELDPGQHSDLINNRNLPNVGDHVEVTGIHVLDAENATHGWLEIQPVTKIRVLN